jgi:hypothetical protein
MSAAFHMLAVLLHPGGMLSLNSLDSLHLYQLICCCIVVKSWYLCDNGAFLATDLQSSYQLREWCKNVVGWLSVHQIAVSFISPPLVVWCIWLVSSRCLARRNTYTPLLVVQFCYTCLTSVAYSSFILVPKFVFIPILHAGSCNALISFHICLLPTK